MTAITIPSGARIAPPANVDRAITMAADPTIVLRINIATATNVITPASLANVAFCVSSNSYRRPGGVVMKAYPSG
jgi:hypothetical protein